MLGNTSQALAGNFAAAFDGRVVFIVSFVEIPMTTDVLNFGIFRFLEMEDKVRFFDHFSAMYNIPNRYVNYDTTKSECQIINGMNLMRNQRVKVVVEGG